MRIRALASTLALVAGLGTAMAAAEPSAPHDVVKIGGRTCFSDHYHTGAGEGATKEAARQKAIRSWADFVDFEYGSAWARFSLAASPQTVYTKEASGWSAVIEARPCKGR